MKSTQYPGCECRSNALRESVTLSQPNTPPKAAGKPAHLRAEGCFGDAGKQRVRRRNGVWRLHAEIGREVVQLLQLLLYQVIHILHLLVVCQAFQNTDAGLCIQVATNSLTS